MTSLSPLVATSLSPGTMDRTPLSPVSVVEGSQIPHESSLEKLRIAEALLARDTAIYYMESVREANRAKDSTILRLQQEKENLETKLAIHMSKNDSGAACCKETDHLRKSNAELEAKLEALTLSPQLKTAMASIVSHKPSPLVAYDILSPTVDALRLDESPTGESIDATMQARFAVLAELPIPEDMSSDTLVPIVIPSPFSLEDFLGTILGPMKVHLTDYRVFQEKTTSWCPDREEHGYYLTPFFKCSTNPRVITAHRWNAVDLDAELNKSSECFFNKDGKWYYAGVYKTFRLKDITPEEWRKLPPDTTHTLIKETIHHRKNTSPQNVYEVGQLYSAGALRAACVGLQCVGFNEPLYNALLIQADMCAKTGRWRATGATIPWNGGNDVKTPEGAKD